jgi:hypothetical protein
MRSALIQTNIGSTHTFLVACSGCLAPPEGYKTPPKLLIPSHLHPYFQSVLLKETLEMGHGVRSSLFPKQSEEGLMFLPSSLSPQHTHDTPYVREWSLGDQKRTFRRLPGFLSKPPKPLYPSMYIKHLSQSSCCFSCTTTQRQQSRTCSQPPSW